MAIRRRPPKALARRSGRKTSLRRAAKTPAAPQGVDVAPAKVVKALKRRAKPRPIGPTQPRKLIPAGERRSTPAADKLTDRGEAIFKEFRNRRIRDAANKSSRTPVRPYDKALSYLKRSLYKVLRPLICSKGGDRTIRNLHRVNNILHNGPSYTDNPFYWGILALDRDAALEAQDLSLFAKQMLYAHRNNVPPCFLIGFIYQTANAPELSEKLRNGSVEQWDVDDRAMEFETPRAKPSKRETLLPDDSE